MIATSFLVGAVLQTIWIVDAANGPGTNFTQLAPAVAAAAHGDVVIVRAGAYGPFNVSGKALTIRGAGAAMTTVTSGLSSSQSTIASVPAGSVFYSSGLAFSASQPASSNPSSADPAIRISGPGKVVLSDTSLAGFHAMSANANPALTIDGGAEVHLARCSLTGGGSYLQNGGSGAVVGPGCKLAADASTFTGGVGWFGFFSGGGQGVLVQGGQVTLSRCNASGGDYGIPGAGVRVIQGSFARIAGNASTAIQAGAPGSPSIFADATSSVVVHGSVSVAQPTSGTVTAGAPALPYAAITGVPAGGGELQATSPVTVTFEGQPLAPFVCIVDVTPSFSTAFAPLLVAELLVPVPLSFALEGTLPASGSLQFSVTPSVVAPAVLDLPLYLQLGVLDSGLGNIRMSNGLIRVFKI